MKQLSDYIDENGFIIHLDHEIDSRGGDSSQRTHMMYVFDLPGVTKERVLETWRKQNMEGEPVRHWDSRYWPGKPGTMSRDNLTPAVCALAVYGCWREFWALMFRIAIRGGMLWNTKKIGQQTNAWKVPDWSGPFYFLLALRTLPIVGYVFSPLCDVYFFLQILVRCMVARKDWDDVGDDLNLCVIGETYRKIHPTPLTKAILRFYLRYRPQAGPEPRIKDCGVYQALDWYFHQDIAPPLPPIMRQNIHNFWWK